MYVVCCEVPNREGLTGGSGEREVRLGGEEAMIPRERKRAIVRLERDTTMRSGRCVRSRKFVSEGDTICEGKKMSRENETYESRN